MQKQRLSEQFLKRAVAAEDEMRTCLEQDDFKTAERYEIVRDRAFEAALAAESAGK